MFDSSSSFDFISNSSKTAAARQVMEKKIEDGRASGAKVITSIQTHVPADRIMRGRAINVRPYEGKARGLVLESDAGAGRIHTHALSQLAQRAGVPAQYLHELSVGEKSWQRTLAADILNEHYKEGHSEDRYLVRSLPSVQNEVRAFLSDRFRRLDCRPMVDALAGECMKSKLVLIEGHATDIRVAVKAVLPIVFEVNGDVLCLGIEWGNSDYGAARHTMRTFLYRLWCLNGATTMDVLGEVHLGGRLGDNIEYSDRTYRLDTAASVAALTDTVRSLVSPKHVNAMLSVVATASAKETTFERATAGLSRRLTKGEIKSAKDAFESEDTINLPAGNTVWRASNALSWIANQTENEDRKLDLQRFAGQVLDGRADKTTPVG